MDAEDGIAMVKLADLRELAGDHRGADTLARRDTEAPLFVALMILGEIRKAAEDYEGAEVLFQCAADAGCDSALTGLARLLEQAGDDDGAEALRRYGLEPDGTPASCLALNPGDLQYLHPVSQQRYWRSRRCLPSPRRPGARTEPPGVARRMKQPAIFNDVVPLAEALRGSETVNCLPARPTSAPTPIGGSPQSSQIVDKLAGRRGRIDGS